MALSAKVIWGVVKDAVRNASLPVLRPTICGVPARGCATKLVASSIQFLLGHVSVQTTERYLGCKQRLRNAVNDRIGLEPSA